MDRAAEVLLEILRDTAAGRQCRLPDGLTRADWYKLVSLSRQQCVLPMVAHAVWDPSNADISYMDYLRRRALRETERQAHRTADFLEVYKELVSRGISFAVVKGCTARSLYPYPEQRSSIDEDLFIPSDDFERAGRVLVSFGFTSYPASPDYENAREIAYCSAERDLCIEVHRSLFPGNDGLFDRLDAFFSDSLDRGAEIPVYGIPVKTLCPTDHLLFLILHAYKHLLYSGIGIRPVLDLGLMAKEYRDSIDWQYIYDCCAGLDLTCFAAALFRITEKYLGFFIPEVYGDEEVDERDLLADILDAGIYGTSDMNRIHSSRITLNAVTVKKKGGKAAGVFAAAFPGKEYLEKHYPYAQNHPYLLPVAWAQRIVTYLGDKKKNNPGKSLSIGRSRVELLREYGIISVK